MLSIRFSRKGKKKYSVYRLIITEKQKDPFGDYLENLGTYNPHTKEAELNAERIKYWLERGAQATASVHNLLVEKKVITADKVRASKSKPGKKKRAQLELRQAEESAKKTEEQKQAAAPAPEASQPAPEDSKDKTENTDKPIEEKSAEPQTK